MSADPIVLARAAPGDELRGEGGGQLGLMLGCLPAVTGNAARSANRLYKRRLPLETSIGGMPLRIATDFPSDAAAGAASPLADIAFTIGGRPGLLRLPRRALHRLLAAIDPLLDPDAIDDEFAALLLEMAVAPDLERLELRIEQPLSIRSAGRPGDAIAFDDGITIRIGMGAAVEAGILFLEARDVDTVAELLAERPVDPADAGAFPIELGLRVGVARLTAGEVSSLRCGDVVLLDSPPSGQERVAAVAAERWVFLGSRTASGIALKAPRRRAAGNELEIWTMDESNNGAAPAAAAADAEFDELPVKLVFEVARKTITLGQLRTLAPGQVFDFGRDLTESVNILGNGRQIGIGELLRVGDALGVRVTRLFGHE